MSTEATVVNHGVLPIVNVSLEAYIKHAEVPDGITIEDQFGESKLSVGILRVEEPTYFQLYRLIFTGGRPFTKLDGAIVAHFAPRWAPFWKHYRFFRFAIDGNGLRQVPAENIEDDYWAARKELEKSEVKAHE